MNKWIVRAAILTGLLGFAGAVYVMISLFTATTGEKNVTSKIDTPINIEIAKPIQPFVKKPENVIEKPVEIPTEQVTDKIPESIVKYIEKEKPKPFKEKPVAAPAPPVVEAKDDPSTRFQTSGENRTLNQIELDEVMTKLDDEIFRTKSKSNCIRLVIMKYGNNEIAVSQIESYLRKERYVISGKETTLQNLKGARANATGRCIVMTIGSF